jgi:hypothetical protein
MIDSEAAARDEVPGGPNLAVWVAILVPVVAVLGSAVTLYLAYSGREPELPAQYAWEGAPLDRDLARAGRARELGVSLALDFGTPDLVRARLAFAADAPAPESLRMQLTHATLPALDREIRLVREAGTASEYVARSAPLPRGHWLVQVESGEEWRVRGEFDAPRTQVALGTAAPVAPAGP